MNLGQLTESLHSTADPGLPDLERIVTEGRRQRARRRLVGLGAGLATVVVVAAPIAFVAQLDKDGEAGFATPTGVPDTTYRLADPVGSVMRTGSKFYLPPAHSASRGFGAIWTEVGARDSPSLHYGWQSEKDDTVRNVGVLVEEGYLAYALLISTIPEQPVEEPTFVVTYPMKQDQSADDYAIAVESDSTDVKIRQDAGVLPGSAVFTVTALHKDGGLPELTYLNLTGPDGLSIGVNLVYGPDGLGYQIDQQHRP